MKLGILAFAVAALSGTGAHANMVEVSPSLVPAYIAVVQKVISDKTVDCSHVFLSFRSSFGSSQQVYVDSTGAQPALMFIFTEQFSAISAKDIRKIITQVTTSSDYKTVISIKAELQELSVTYGGTIITPEVKEEFVTKYTSICN